MPDLNVRSPAAGEQPATITASRNCCTEKGRTPEGTSKACWFGAKARFSVP